MRKPVRIFTSVVMAAVMLIMSVGSVSAAGQGTVVAEWLNMRAEPDMGAAIVGKLSAGMQVEVTDTKDGWYKVEYGDEEVVKAWVVSEYLQVEFDVVQVASDDVNIRKNPSTEADVIKRVDKFERFIVVGTFNDWFKIKLEDNSTGWVNDQYALVTGKISRGMLDGVDTRDQSTIRDVNEPAKSIVKMIVKGNRVNFREQPDLDATVVALLKGDEVVTVLDNLGEWRRIKTSGGQIGYINKMFLKEIEAPRVQVDAGADSSGKTVIPKKAKAQSGGGSSSAVASSGGSSGGGSKLITYAKQFMGIRYKWGGTTTKGFDCSGYTQYIMRHFGASIPRVSRDQARAGTAVSKENLRVGDVVYFAKSASNRTVNHVGIYIGGGNFIHSSSGGGGKGVTVSNLNSGSYLRRYAGARRYLSNVP